MPRARRSVSLALVLHNHQPVGNFGWVLEEIWERAYEPMIGALERHPGVRVGLHYTGPLLEWMAATVPDGLHRIAALARRDQVELLGGGWTEPILVSLPARDRHAQLVRMADELERWVGVRPRGAWLAERVWEPALAFDLAEAGYEYTVVDDNHLRAGGVPADGMWGTYITDDQGRKLTVFGTEQGLRYTIPWRPVPEVIGHLRRNASADGLRLGTMGDDGEKFGAWPDTYRYCWGPRGWVDRFFTALEREQEWLSTVRPGDWLRRVPPLGRIAMPSTSYIEMTEWALPPDQAVAFHRAVERAQREDDPALPFLRGSTWRSFQTRYREVNDLHKQMLRASAAVDGMRAGAARDRARDHLHGGQSNDVYWHGLFGGIYLPDLRLAVGRELIAAEDLATRGRPRTVVADHDLDGVDEVLLAGPGQVVLIDLADGGAIGEWDLLARRVPLASVIRRRPEASHLAVAEAARAARDERASGPRSPHEAMASKEEGLERYLVYDRHERRSGIVHLLPAGGGERLDGPELAAEAFRELGDPEAPAEVVELTDRRLVTRTAGPLGITRTLELSGSRRRPALELRVALEPREDAREQPVVLDVEWNLCLLGGGGNPHAWYEVSRPGGAAERSPHDGRGDVHERTGLAFGNDLLGVRIETALDPPARATWFPVETVSNSEAGFERVYQGSSLHLRWTLEPRRGAPATVSIRHTAIQGPDLAKAERAGGEARPRLSPGERSDGTRGAQRGGASQRRQRKAGRKPSEA